MRCQCTSVARSSGTWWPGARSVSDISLSLITPTWGRAFHSPHQSHMAALGSGGVKGLHLLGPCGAGPWALDLWRWGTELDADHARYCTDPSHRSHNVLDQYPTMHHFVTEMCTHVHISVTKWCIVGYGIGAWDLHYWSSVQGTHHCISFTAQNLNNMMASWHGNTFCITDPLWGESICLFVVFLTNSERYRVVTFSLLLAWTQAVKQSNGRWFDLPWYHMMTLIICSNSNVWMVSWPYTLTLTEIMIESPLVKNHFCNWGLFIHRRIVHSQINIDNNNSTDIMMLNNLLSTSYQNELP